MKIVKPLWTTLQLENLVHVLARDSSKVIITIHCHERMVQRGVSAIEVLRCLQRGRIVDEPTYNQKNKHFVFSMSEPSPRDIVRVVAAVEPNPEPGKLFAVTVWEI